MVSLHKDTVITMLKAFYTKEQNGKITYHIEDKYRGIMCEMHEDDGASDIIFEMVYDILSALESQGRDKIYKTDLDTITIQPFDDVNDLSQWALEFSEFVDRSLKYMVRIKVSKPYFELLTHAHACHYKELTHTVFDVLVKYQKDLLQE